MPDLAPSLAVAADAAQAAGALIGERIGRARDVRTKGLHDLVTEVDEAAERLILDRIGKAFPADAILAEESAGDTPEAGAPGRRWIVDPLDGTTNFTQGIPPFAVSIALEDEEGLAAAAVYEVTRGELFTATRGEGLRLDGRSAHVSTTERLEESVLATGFPFRDFAFEAGYVETFRALIRAARGLRRHGAASVDLAWTAVGRFDGFFEAGLAPWDLAAGILLVQEGGGRVTTLAGEPGAAFDGGVVATNGRIHETVLDRAAPLARAWAQARG